MRCFVAETNTHANHQVWAFFRAEEVARRELRASFNRFDDAVVRTRVAVDVCGSRRSNTNGSQRSLRDEHIGVGMLGVAKREDGRARCNHLTGVQVHVENGATDGRTQREACKARVGCGESGACGVDACESRFEFFGSRTALNRSSAVGDRITLRCGACDLISQVVDLRRGYGAARGKGLCAFQVVLHEFERCVCGAKFRPSASDVGSTSSGAKERDLSFGGAYFGGARIAEGTLKTVVELRKNLTRCDHSSARDGNRANPPRNLEADLRFIELDDPLVLADVGVGGTLAADPRRDQKTKQTPTLKVFCHATDNRVILPNGKQFFRRPLHSAERRGTMSEIQSGPYKSFDAFWPFYVREHSKPGTRVMHYLGSVAALSLLGWLIAEGHGAWFALAFVPGYAGAWIGHFFIEKNRPATFKYPFYSFAADWKMNAYAITGRMGAEVERVCGTTAATSEVAERSA